MGAWIEIVTIPVWCDRWPVAPLVGAWIEIVVMGVNLCTLTVAPLVGAWIEIVDLYGAEDFNSRRSPCGSVD